MKVALDYGFMYSPKSNKPEDKATVVFSDILAFQLEKLNLKTQWNIVRHFLFTE